MAGPWDDHPGRVQGRKQRAAPQSHHARMDTEHPWRAEISLSRKSACLLPICTHSFPPSGLHPFKITYGSHWNLTACLWCPGKSLLTRRKSQAKPLQADLLKAQRAFPAWEISQVGHQPRVGPESLLVPAMGLWFIQQETKLLLNSWAPEPYGACVPEARFCPLFMLLKCCISKCLRENSDRNPSRVSVYSHMQSVVLGSGECQCQGGLAPPSNR